MEQDKGYLGNREEEQQIGQRGQPNSRRAFVLKPRKILNKRIMVNGGQFRETAGRQRVKKAAIGFASFFSCIYQLVEELRYNLQNQGSILAQSQVQINSHGKERVKTTQTIVQKYQTGIFVHQFN